MYPKKLLRWYLLYLIFVMLIMGKNSPVDLFWFIHKLPVFASMDKPAKYFNFFHVFIVAITGTSVIQVSRGFLRKHVRFYESAVLVLITLTALPLLNQGRHVYKNLFNLTLGAVPRNDVFCQTYLMDQDRTSGKMYYNLLMNMGTINWYGAILLKENAAPRYFLEYKGEEIHASENNDYFGEIYFMDEREGKYGIHPSHVKITANKITIRLPQNQIKEKELARLVINQNYHKSWRSNIGKVQEYNGLISVDLSRINEDVLVLKYVPLDFYIGALISFLTLLFLLIYSGIFKRIKRFCQLFNR